MKRVSITCNVLDGSICVSGVTYSMKKKQTIELDMSDDEFKRISPNKYFAVKPGAKLKGVKKQVKEHVGQEPVAEKEKTVTEGKSVEEKKVDTPAEVKEPKTLAELVKNKNTQKAKGGKAKKKPTVKSGKKASSKKSSK